MADARQTIMQKLTIIQSQLKAPKSQYNSFGKYNYRNCEDILESLKPILQEVEAVVLLSDEIIQVGDRFYVKAIAEIRDDNGSIFVTAYAREDDSKKGMDAAQVTGSTSSYARKYALNGLFAIDDTKDSDTTNQPEKKQKENNVPPQQTHLSPQEKPQKQESNYPAQAASNQDKASDSQLKAIFAISKKNNVSEEDIKSKFGISSMKEISKKQASLIIESLQQASG